MNNITRFENHEGKSFNGRRLRVARSLRGISATEFAKKVGLQRQTISMYENGKLTNPDFTTILKFSEILDFPAKFFMEDLKQEQEDTPIYFRSLLTAKKRYKLEQEEKMLFITAICNMLSEYVNFFQLNLPKIAPGTSPEDAAIKLREYWELGRGPVKDLIQIVERNGIFVIEFETNTNDVDAYSRGITINGSSSYLIGYSKNKSSAARIHFDIAHELGHILLHGDNYKLEDMDKDEFKMLEKEAHAFASAFLLPKESFGKDIALCPTKLEYYTDLKKKWKVSIAAMVRRAYDLSIITNEEYSRLYRYMQKKGIRKVEPLDDILKTAKPSLFKQAVNLVIDNAVFSSAEFVEEISRSQGLTLYSSDVEELLGLEKGVLQEEVNIEQLTLKK